MSSEEPKSSWNAAKLGATLWLLIIITALGGGGVAAIWKLEVTGSVSADVFVQNVVFPLAVAVAGILALGSYVAMRVLWGEKTTDSALSRLVGLVREAGAAQELRKELDRKRDE